MTDGTIDAHMIKLSRRPTSLLLMLGTAVLVAAAFATATNLFSTSAAERSADNQSGTGASAGRVYAAPSPAVGALFTRSGGQLGQHFCTASVVASRTGDLVITAAHCVTGVSFSPRGSIVFAPGYSDGRFPHGLWAVTRKFVDADWTTRQDPDDDVAFLSVTPLKSTKKPAGTLEHIAGAERLRFEARLPLRIHAIGYPDGSDQAVSCPAKATSFRPESLHQVMFACPGFTDGTSGGPFLSDFDKATGIGAIIGVIGGYQQGGDSPSISYSSAFSASIRTLYEQALKTG